jgi:hypothetical protein
MKLRTFVTCEDIDVNRDDKSIIIKNMFAKLYNSSFPYSESIVLILTFDEVEEVDKILEFALLNSKGKLVSSWKREIKKKQNSIATKLKVDFPTPDKYSLKVSYNNEFLGKFPLSVIKGEGGGTK